jgi:hypothetical protein
MYVWELNNTHPSINIIGAITSRGPKLEAHEHISHNPSLKRIIDTDRGLDERTIYHGS